MNVLRCFSWNFRLLAKRMLLQAPSVVLLWYMLPLVQRGSSFCSELQSLRSLESTDSSHFCTQGLFTSAQLYLCDVIAYHTEHLLCVHLLHCCIFYLLNTNCIYMIFYGIFALLISHLQIRRNETFVRKETRSLSVTSHFSYVCIQRFQ